MHACVHAYIHAMYMVFRYAVTRREVKVTFELCIHLMEEVFRVKEKNWVRAFALFAHRCGMLSTTAVVSFLWSV